MTYGMTLKPLLACVASVALLAACDSGNEMAQMPEENEMSAPGDTAAEGEFFAYESEEVEELEGLDPRYLHDRVLTDGEGRIVGDITEVVIDNDGDLFAVIDMDKVWERDDEGLAVAPVEDIQREQNQLLLMSQAADLETYEAGAYQPYKRDKHAPETETNADSDY